MARHWLYQIFFSCMTTLWSTASFNNHLGPPIISPEAIEQPDRVLPEGSNVLLGCSVKADPDTLFFEWFRNKEPLDLLSPDRYRMQANGALRIKVAQPEDSGVYSCRAINGFGQADLNITLIILAKNKNTNPKRKSSNQREIPGVKDKSRTDQPSQPVLINVTVANNGTFAKPVGSSLKLKCLAEGKPPPNVTWMKDGLPLDISRASPGSKRGAWTLQLRNMQETDSGRYTCIAYNLHGHVNHTFDIRVLRGVQKKPKLRGAHPMNTTVDIGESAAFQCRVRSHVPPNVQWLKQDDPKRAEEEGYKVVKLQGEYFRILKSTEMREKPDGSFLNKLIIPDAKQRDSGKYICLGANTMGFSFRSAFLIIRPTEPAYPDEHEEDTGTDTNLLIPYNPLFITIPVSLGIFVILLIGLVTHWIRRRPRLNIPRPATKTSTVKATMTSQQGQCPIGDDFLTTLGKIAFHNALQSSDGTWSHTPSTLALDGGQADSFSECGSSFVFWGDPTLYPNNNRRGDNAQPQPHPNFQSIPFTNNEYIRYLDNV